MARTPKVVEDRREQIIDAAMHVFAQKGFARATNKDVAREASITPGLIYHYFANKEDLLMAVIEARSPLQLVSSLPEEVFTLPPDKFFRLLVTRVLIIVEDEQFVQLLRVLISELLFRENAHLAQLIPTLLQRVLNFLETYLEAKMKTGALRHADSELTAQAFVGSVLGFVLRRQLLQDATALQYTQEQIVETVVSAVLQGLLPR